MTISPRHPTLRVWLGFAAAFILPAIYAVWMLLIEPIPPRNLTAARMFILKRRILAYSQAHDALPPNLAALPPMASNIDSQLIDAWEQPIIYRVDALENVTLCSLGADWAKGGTGDNRDMTAIFSGRDPSGHWADPTEPWIKDPMNP